MLISPSIDSIKQDSFNSKRKTSSKKSKKSKKSNLPSGFVQPEFNFTPKYIIQWHCVNEDPNLKNKKGYKTRIRKVIDIVDGSTLYFDSLESASNFIEKLCSAFLEHHYSNNLFSNKQENLFTEFNKKDSSVYTFTVKGYSLFVTYWIEVKQA